MNPDDSLEDLQLDDLIAKFKSMGTPTKRKMAKRLSLPEDAFFSLSKDSDGIQTAKKTEDAAAHQSEQLETEPALITPPKKNETSEASFITPTAPSTLKRKKYSLDFRTKIGRMAAYFDNNLAVARYYSVDESNVRYWRKKLPEEGKPRDEEDLEDEIFLFDKYLKECNKKKSPKFPKMEEKLLRWFADERAEKNPVSRRMIMSKALEIIRGTKEAEDDVFKASTGWFYGFCKRWRISRRKATHAIQSLPQDFKARLQEFFEEVKDKRQKFLKKNGESSHIIFGKE